MGRRGPAAAAAVAFDHAALLPRNSPRAGHVVRRLRRLRRGLRALGQRRHQPARRRQAGGGQAAVPQPCGSRRRLRRPGEPARHAVCRGLAGAGRSGAVQVPGERQARGGGGGGGGEAHRRRTRRACPPASPAPSPAPSFSVQRTDEIVPFHMVTYAQARGGAGTPALCTRQAPAARRPPPAGDDPLPSCPCPALPPATNAINRLQKQFKDYVKSWGAKATFR